MLNPFFKNIVGKDRFLQILFENLPESIPNDELYHQITHYLSEFVAFNELSEEDVLRIYTDFIKVFNKHCKQFVKTNEYPYQTGGPEYKLARIEYDIILMMSVLFTPHRFRIMQLLNEGQPAEKGLFIGLGPGIELLLTNDNIQNVDSYDLSVNPFVPYKFPNAKINADLYTGQQTQFYDLIYMIELLEHIEDPYVLIKNCHDSLKAGGKVILTTATDIPQFDHLYNFPVDHTDFEKRVEQMGFKMLFKERIDHDYLIMDINPCNHFYIFEKR